MVAMSESRVQLLPPVEIYSKSEQTWQPKETGEEEDNDEEGTISLEEALASSAEESSKGKERATPEGEMDSPPAEGNFLPDSPQPTQRDHFDPPSSSSSPSSEESCDTMASSSSSTKTGSKRHASKLAESRSKDDQPSKRVLITRPTCTHISMVKIFFNLQNPIFCHNCGRVPSIGFIYACEQDQTHPPFQKPVNTLSSSAANGPKQPKKLIKSRRRASSPEKVVDTAPLSKWITTAINEGHYTPDQIEKLVAQKAHLQTVTAQTQAEVEDLKSKNGPSARLLEAKLKQEKEKDKHKTDKSRRRSLSKSVALCDYKVCHTCRPNSREKSFVSFESVFNDEVELPATWQKDTMPVSSMEIVRNLGLRPAPEYVSTPRTERSDIAESNTNPYHTPPERTTPTRPTTWSPTSNQIHTSASSEGLRSNLRKSLLDLLRTRLRMPSPASAPASIPTTPASPNDSAYASADESSPTSSGQTEADMASIETRMLGEHTTSLDQKLETLTNLCTSPNGAFDQHMWHQMSEELIANVELLDIPGEHSAVSAGDLARISEASEEGDLGVVDREEVMKWHREQEGKLRALKEVEEEDVEAGLDLELTRQAFSGLGLRLTEEAVETGGPDVVLTA